MGRACSEPRPPSLNFGTGWYSRLRASSILHFDTNSLAKLGPSEHLGSILARLKVSMISSEATARILNRCFGPYHRQEILPGVEKSQPIMALRACPVPPTSPVQQSAGNGTRAWFQAHLPARKRFVGFGSSDDPDPSTTTRTRLALRSIRSVLT